MGNIICNTQGMRRIPLWTQRYLCRHILFTQNLIDTLSNCRILQQHNFQLFPCSIFLPVTLVRWRICHIVHRRIPGLEISLFSLAIILFYYKLYYGSRGIIRCISRKHLYTAQISVRPADIHLNTGCVEGIALRQHVQKGKATLFLLQILVCYSSRNRNLTVFSAEKRYLCRCQTAFISGVQFQSLYLCVAGYLQFCTAIHFNLCTLVSTAGNSTGNACIVITALSQIKTSAIIAVL